MARARTPHHTTASSSPSPSPTSTTRDRLYALVRDHLADHPDNLLAAYIASQHTRSRPSRPQPLLGATLHHFPPTLHHLPPTPHHLPPTPAPPPVPPRLPPWLPPPWPPPRGPRRRRHPLSARPTRRALDGDLHRLPARRIRRHAVVGRSTTRSPPRSSAAWSPARILGAVQAFGLGRSGPPARQWISATALGLMAWARLGAALVDYGPASPRSSSQGAVSRARRRCRAGHPASKVAVRADSSSPGLPRSPLIWAVGWAVTTSIGVQVDDQFTVFGSSGATHRHRHCTCRCSQPRPAIDRTVLINRPQGALMTLPHRLRHRPGRPPRRRAARRSRRMTSSLVNRSGRRGSSPAPGSSPATPPILRLHHGSPPTPTSFTSA